jgi:hypothetical protein
MLHLDDFYALDERSYAEMRNTAGLELSMQIAEVRERHNERHTELYQPMQARTD